MHKEEVSGRDILMGCEKPSVAGKREIGRGTSRLEFGDAPWIRM